MLVKAFICYWSSDIYAYLQITSHIYNMSGVEISSSFSLINDYTLIKSLWLTIFWIELINASDSFDDICVSQYL
jgi:hypothetical protein